MSSNTPSRAENELFQRMRDSGIDIERSRHILERYNAGGYDGVEAVRASGIPEIDGDRIIDRRKAVSLTMAEADYRQTLGALAPEIPADRFGHLSGQDRQLGNEDLRKIGVLLYPYVSYGVLNGGSATSYGDRKKNESFDSGLYALYREEFEKLAVKVTGQPKGITPAYINPDGSPGASFLELKFRMILQAGREYARTAQSLGVQAPALAGEKLLPGLPVFEMTSHFTDDALHDAYDTYRNSPFLTDLSDQKLRNILLDTRSAVQPLLAALTHSAEGRPKRFFTAAHGKNGEPLGLPGGHGQNFQVLAPIYRQLHRMGKKFVYLGNVDNVGFTIDPVSIALVALRGVQGGFDFAFRTPVDVKGGVLLYDQNERLNCADIGPAISKEAILTAEESGKKILFNCASGLFSLDYLVPALDRIVEDLPMRISDQDKDAGRYSQAEQVTWEIIGMLDDILIFGIDKYHRFLAAKMLLDMFLTSGLKREEAIQFQSTAGDLADGLARVLREQYGLELQNGRWVPAPRGA